MASGSEPARREADVQPLILVVDDSPTDLRRASEPLRRGGYRVLTARDGDQGLGLAVRERPDLVVLDAVLPRRGGLRVCRELKAGAHTAAIKVLLLLVGRGQEGDRGCVLKLGADACLAKPLFGEELLAAVARLL
jgi:twitching motility two-component system response regulator PilH